MSKKFWEAEYRDPKHLKMSEEPSGDLLKFEKWTEINAEWPVFEKGNTVLDLGSGNGRNLIYICEKANMKGVGIELSEVAVSQAKKRSEKLPITYYNQSITEPIPLEDGSVDLVIDMMTSHYLKEKEREFLLQEVVRVLKPYGWYFLKTFILEGDIHAKKLIADNPSDEKNAYIHPKIGLHEYVWTENAIIDTFSPHFKIHRILKSHKHMSKEGKALKRRSVSVYMEKLS